MSSRTLPTANTNGDHHDDGVESNGEFASNPPDSPSSVEELDPNEIPLLFSERDDRLFPSGNTPYPLPVDTPEHERLTLSHNILKQLLGGNYVGPVLDVLKDEDGRQRKSLDLCTGKGDWVLDMAADYSRVRFTGIDIVPIATRYPPANVQFEMHNVNERLRWNADNFDLVHARSVSMAVRDYRQVLREVARVLCPGGLFISYEWGRYAAFDPSLQRDLSAHAPASWRFFNALNAALDFRRGILPVASHIPSFLASSGLFTEITPTQYYVPIGSWHTDATLRTIGAAFVEVHKTYAESVRFLLREAGWAQQDIDSIVSDYVEEIQTVHGLVSVLYTVHARRA